VYETPGGTLLVHAHRELEALCLDRDTLHYKDVIANRYAELVYYGQWYTPLRVALQAFIDQTQLRVTGSVRLKLYKGNIITAGRTSPYSLYREDLATFGQEDVYDQSDAKGFIKLFGLPMKVNALIDITGENRYKSKSGQSVRITFSESRFLAGSLAAPLGSRKMSALVSRGERGD
jgi:argininosuccinate synthase